METEVQLFNSVKGCDLPTAAMPYPNFGKGEII